MFYLATFILKLKYYENITIDNVEKEFKKWKRTQTELNYDKYLPK